MQALYKMVASFLSVALIFTSVAPSFAQVLQTPKVGFRVSASNSLEEAFTRQLAKAHQQSEEEYWVGRGEVLTGEINKYHYWEDLSAKLLEASNQANGYIEQAVVCSADNTECIPALAYAWGGIHRGIKDENLYSRGQIIDSVAPDFAWIVSNYGIYSESDRKEAVRYFYDLVKMAKNDCTNGAFEYGSPSHRADQRIASERQAKKCATEVSVIPALAMISKGSAEEQKAAQTFYDLLEDNYDTAVGGAVIQACVTGLGVLGTPKAYSLLEKFLTEDTIPSTTGNVFAGIGSPFQSLAQNGLRVASNVRGGNSRYLNRINENLQYLDKEEAKRQGFQTTVWQGEGIQYPYANMLEEVGAFLGQQSASNVYARALAKKLVGQANEAVKTQTNAAGVMHYPLVLGIMDGWRAHGKKFIYEPTPELINFFYKGDWFDINEGTQQRVHYKAYQFAKARGWTPELPKRNQAKIQRTIYNSRLMTIGGAGDGVLTVLMTGYLVKSIPALLRGIPQGVKILSSHKTWVGAANYFKNAPKSMWTRVKGGPRAQEITLKPTAPARTTATTPRTRTAQNTTRQPAKPTGQNAPRQGYTTVDMGMQNGQRTVAIATTPEQQAALTAQRANIAPKTFASTGDGFANAGKTQVLVDEAAATGQQGQAAAQAAGNAAPAAQPVTPRWIEVETTNALGNTVKTWKPNPAHPEYNQILAELSGNPPGRELSWLDKARLNWAINWKPTFQNMFTFGKSRYGAAALAPGVAPVTSEAAIMANTPVIAQTVRAQQSAFIAEEFLRGGAGASYRVGAVNPGGVAAAHYAQAALNAVNPATQAAKILAMSVGASRTAQTVAPRYGNGMAYSLVFPVPSFIMNRLLRTPMSAEDGSDNIGGGSDEDVQTKILNRLPQYLEELETYAQTHNGELPRNLAYYITRSDIHTLTEMGLDNHPLVQRYHQLQEESQAKRADKAAAKKQKQQEKQERKKEAYLAELPELLQRLESYATLHDGKLHPKKWWKEDNATYEKVAAGIKYLKKHGLADHPLVARFSALTEAAAQKQAAKKQTKQQKDASQNKELMMLKAYLSKLEEFAREHDNRLPEDNPVAKGYDLRKQVEDRISLLKARKVLANDDPLIQRYKRLVEADRLQHKQVEQARKQQEKQEHKQARLQQKAQLAQLKAAEQEAEKELENQSDNTIDSNATTAALLAKDHFVQIKEVTEELIVDLINFYNKIDPFGVGKFTVKPSQSKPGAQSLPRAEQEIQNALRETSAAQAASQNWLDTQLDEIENEWAEEEDIYKAMRQTSAAQAAGQQRLSQELDAAERELLEQETRAQDEADLNAALAQTSAAHANSQSRLEAELDAAEAEFIKEEQKKSAAKARQEQTDKQPAQEVTLSGLEQAISQFIELPMPFFLFEGILQNIFTSTDEKIAALADTHKRGRRPGYASLWLKTAEEENFDTHGLGLVKLAKDKQSPLLPLFKLREETPKAALKQTATAQETAVEQMVPETPAPTQENPGTGDQLLTGIDGLKTYLPNWRAQLSATKAGFSKEQLDAIEAAFITTDEAMFAKDAEGNLIYNPNRSKEAWNYSQTFTDILSQNEISFTPNQYRQIVGGVGARGFTLSSIFRLYENMAFVLSQQRKPQKAIYQDSKDITSQIKAQAKLDTQAGKRNTPAQLQVEEIQLGIRTSVLLTSLRKEGQENTPIYQAFIALQDPFNTQKSYEEWFALLKEFTDTYHRWPHQAFSREEESKIPLEQQIKEKQLATAANRSMSRLKAAGMEGSPIYQAFKQLQKEYRTRKTPEEWIALLEQFTTQYKRWPRAHISENDIIVTDQIQRQAKLDTEHGLTNTQAQQIWAEVQLGQAVNALSGQWKKAGQTDSPLYQKFKVLKDLYGATFRQPKSSKELWEETLAYVTTHKKFPLSRSVIGKALDSRLRYYQSAMVDGKYVDPWLQQLYELKLAIQAAPTGKFTITPDGKGSYILEIKPEALQEIAVEESASKPTHHSIRLRVTDQIKQAMENAQEQDVLERNNFSKWVWTMNSLDYRNLLINRETSDALYNIARNVKADAQKHIARLKVTYLVNTLNNIRTVLRNSTAQTYYRLIYHGTVAENKLPIANNFHIVAEEKGIDRQEQVAKQAESFLAKHPELSVFIDERNKTHITRIGLKKNVSIDQAAKDLQSLIAHLTPAGYVYRMGEHELGLSGNLAQFRQGNVHLHLESIAGEPTEDGLFVDISLTLDIGAWRFAGWYNKNKEFEPYFDKQIAENYQQLFAPYLNEEGKQALIKIATSSTKK